AINNKKRRTCPGCCPFGWVNFNGRCFSYHSINTDWASAENHCLKLGSNLMSVHNNNEYLLAKALIRAYDPVEPPTWLGLSNCQKKHCLDLGANLVSINSEDEYQMIKALIRAHDPKENPTWIGLTSCVEIYNWFWSDGTELTFTKWNPDEPNNFERRECCVHMNFSVFMNWNDIPCVEKYPFVCVRRLK
ncbi:hypothetical protein QTP86_015758, partial [Hemibagrus guttatus]